jgi:hypothetical protein
MSEGFLQAFMLGDSVFNFTGNPPELTRNPQMLPIAKLMERLTFFWFAGKRDMRGVDGDRHSRRPKLHARYRHERRHREGWRWRDLAEG